MLAALYRITVLTALMAVLTGAPGAASTAHAAEDAPATAANGYTFGGAATRPTGTSPKPDRDESWLSGQLERLSLVGRFTDLGSMTFDQQAGGAAMPYSPRDSVTPLYLGGNGTTSFTPRDSGMLGLVYEAEKWQLGAGYATAPSYTTQDPLHDRIDRYMLGTRYDAFGHVGFGATIELRDYDTDSPAREDNEKVFTFGTYVNF